MKGFRDFLLRGNVVDLAVAVVIGAAFGAVVDGFIKSFVDPLLLSALSTVGAAALDQAKVGIFPIGIFLSALISFILKAFVIYFFVVRPFSNFFSKLSATAAKPDDVVLLTEIRDELRRQNGSSTGRKL